MFVLLLFEFFEQIGGNGSTKNGDAQLGKDVENDVVNKGGPGIFENEFKNSAAYGNYNAQDEEEFNKAAIKEFFVYNKIEFVGILFVEVNDFVGYLGFIAP